MDNREPDLAEEAARLLQQLRAPGTPPPPPTEGGYRTFESLLKMDRAAKVARRTDRRTNRPVFILTLCTAGDDGQRGRIVLAFSHRKQAKTAAGIFIRAIRKAIIDGEIHTDTQYNAAVVKFARTIEQRGKGAVVAPSEPHEETEP